LNNFADKLIRAVEETGMAAVMEVARHANTTAEPMVPVDIGNLRRAMYEEKRGKSVFAITGPNAPGANADANIGSYVWYQYTGALRHRGNVNTELLSLTALHRDALTGTGVYQRTLKDGRTISYTRNFGKRNPGSGEDLLYDRAYRLAVRAGEIVKQDAPEWYDRLNARPSFHDEAADIVVRFFS
jgi:hypothetical protein